MKMRGTTLTSGNSGNKVKTLTYHGQTYFQTYMLLFEAASKANKWCDEKTATYLVVALRGRKLDLLRTVP